MELKAKTLVFTTDGVTTGTYVQYYVTAVVAGREVDIVLRPKTKNDGFLLELSGIEAPEEKIEKGGGF